MHAPMTPDEFRDYLAENEAQFAGPVGVVMITPVDQNDQDN